MLELHAEDVRRATLDTRCATPRHAAPRRATPHATPRHAAPRRTHGAPAPDTHCPARGLASRRQCRACPSSHVRASPCGQTGPAEGVVLEAQMQKGLGVLATVLVQRGELRPGDDFVAGLDYGRVKVSWCMYWCTPRRHGVAARV